MKRTTLIQLKLFFTVQNSSISPTSNSIVAKLLEIDADLAAQEVQLYIPEIFVSFS